MKKKKKKKKNRPPPLPRYLHPAAARSIPPSTPSTLAARTQTRPEEAPACSCFLPAIIFTNLAKNMDAGALSELWILPAVAVLHNIIGVAVGRALLCLFDASCLPKAWRIPHFFRNPFLVGTMFGNSSQLPLVVGYALCAQRPLSLLGFELAWRRYLAGNFIYLIGWNLLFWSVGNAILSSFADDDEVGGDDMTLEIKSIFW